MFKQRTQINEFIDRLKEDVGMDRFLQHVGSTQANGDRWTCPVCKLGDYVVSSSGKWGRCFHASCDATGDMFALSIRLGLSGVSNFNEAVEYIIKEFSTEGVMREWEYLHGIDDTTRKSMARVEDVFAEFYEEIAKDLDDPRVVAYCEGRGLPMPMIKRYNGGFASDAAITRFKERYESGTDFYNTTGLYIDNLRNRLVFAIKDGEGRVISFAARHLSDQENAPVRDFKGKFIKCNSKGHGVHDAYIEEYCPTSYKTKTVVLVEGVFDAIRVQLTYNSPKVHVIPIIGIDVPKELMRRLAKKREVVLFLDTDRGGIEGIRRVFSRNDYGINFTVATIDGGGDPDDATSEKIKEALESRVPIREFLVKYYTDLITRESEVVLDTVYDTMEKFDISVDKELDKLYRQDAQAYMRIMSDALKRVEGKILKAK